MTDGKKRNRNHQLSDSEIMTILIAFHVSGFRTFKHYYLYLLASHRRSFPSLVSYNRFVELIPSVILPLCAYLLSRRGTVTGINFIDATTIKVCHNKRISRNKVFRGVAAIGKSTMGWFHGFKLHLIINEVGELLAIHLTPGNIDDRIPVEFLTENLFGKLFADKGYISQALFDRLFEKGIELITHIKKNMKNKLMPIMDKILLRKRSLIETIFDQLKNVTQIEHTRHRSVKNFLVNLLSGLIAYTHQSKKPSLNFNLGPFNKQCLEPSEAVMF